MNRSNGFTLVELLIALVVFSVLGAGTMSFFQMSGRVADGGEVKSALDANLRIGSERIVDAMRNAGYGVPESAHASWVPWITGHTGQSILVAEGAGTDPDAVSIIGCTSHAVTSLSAETTAGATVLDVANAASADTGSRRTLWIGELEHAQVIHVADGQWTIDTDPIASGAQGLTSAYPAGTPVCRIDVTTFAVDQTTNSLQMSAHDGGGFRTVASDVSDLQVDTVSLGERYTVTLIASSSRRNPLDGNYPVATATRSVSLRNRP